MEPTSRRRPVGREAADSEPLTSRTGERVRRRVPRSRVDGSVVHVEPPSLSTEPSQGSRDTTPEKKEARPRKAETDVVVHANPKGRKRRFTFVFFLGLLFGLIAAGFLAKSNDLIDFPEIGSMETLLDVLPAGLVKDVRDLVVGFAPPSTHEQH